MRKSWAKAAAAALAATALQASATLAGAKIPGLGFSSAGMPASEPNTGGAQEWDAFSLFDGDLGTYYNANWDNPAAEVVFDAGTPRSVTGWRAAMGSDYSKYSGDLYLSIYGSDDKSSWTQIDRQPTTSLPGFANQYAEFSLNAASAPFRYFKFVCEYYVTVHADDWSWSYQTIDTSRGTDGLAGLDFREIELWSEEAMPEADPPAVYGSNGLGALDAAGGVVLSGTLRNGPADVEVWCARRDLGDERDAWAADGSAICVAIPGVGDGAAFSATFPSLGKGRWYWRAFAASGETFSASQQTRPFATGTGASYPVAYVNSSQFWNSWNASLGDFADSATASWIVFDTGSAMSGSYLPSSIRFWPRTDNKIVWNRIRGTKVYASWATDIDWSAFTGTGAPGEGRTIKYDGVNNEAATEPGGFGWQEVATGEMLIEYGAECVELPLPDFETRPAYVKISGIYWGNTKEIEFRKYYASRGLSVIVR